MANKFIISGDLDVVDDDDQLAFDLQIQEAINASLAPSHSSSKLQQHYFHHAAVSPPENVEKNGDAALDDWELALILQDLVKMSQIQKDREQSEMEMVKMIVRDDLDRRIHEQDLVNEWEQKYPYGAEVASSSCADLAEPECFRLYFKGLVSEEKVGDTKVMVAAIGAAICDSRENMILEVKKPLEASEGSGEVLSSEVAELEALIEGLEAALDLPLERLTFFCDDYMLYQYVTGRQEPKRSKVAELVNQVALRQREFTSCNPSLVTRHDIKHAFKSAKETILSQITLPKRKPLKQTCVICLEDTDIDQMFTINKCRHRYCFSCMKQHVEVKLLNGMVAKCPEEACNSELTIDSCRKFLAPKLVEVMKQRLKESSIPVIEKVYCPYPRCSALMSRSEALKYTKELLVNAEQSGVRKCTKCHNLFCITCKVPWHKSMTCYDFSTSNKDSNSNDAKLKSLAREKQWGSCARCNNVVELAEGCYHITCRCGYEFCYTCGAEWKNKKATCSCKIWDEHNIIRNI